jgi:hypothetical protein
MQGGEAPLDFSIVRRQGTVVMTLDGWVGTDSAPRLEKLLGDLINDQGNLDVVVDVTGVTGIRKEPAMVLRAAATTARHRGGRLGVR